MKKRFILGLVILSLFSNLMFAASEENENDDQKDLTSTSQQILNDIRRFEIISLGAMPFVTMDVSLLYSSYFCLSYNPNFSFLPNDLCPQENGLITTPTPFLALTYKPPTDREYTTAEKWENFWGSPCGQVIIGSAICSVSVGVADLFIRLYKRGVFTKKVKVNNKNIKITDLENDPDATKIILRGKEIDNNGIFEIENGFTSSKKIEETQNNTVNDDFAKEDSVDVLKSGEK